MVIQLAVIDRTAAEGRLRHIEKLVVLHRGSFGIRWWAAASGARYLTPSAHPATTR
jgi:hypothetical protein